LVRLVATKSEASDAYYKLMSDRGVSDNSIYATLATAEAAMTTNRNAACLMYPGAHTATAAVTWDLSNSALVGAHAPSPWSNSTKITFSGDATALSPLLTVSGSDNYFKNIHFVDTCGHQDHHGMIKVSGSGNLFEYCWFEGPTHATQADDAAYGTVEVDGGGNTFRNCVFGTTACDTAAAAQVKYIAGQNCYRSTFENCIFYHQASHANACFILCANAGASGVQFFRNCTFASWWNNFASQIANVMTGTGAETAMWIFDGNCQFFGVDALSATMSTMAIFSGHAITGAHAGASAGIILPTSGSAN
jgi:hypothetical protein